MGNSFVLLDVSMETSGRQFHSHTKSCFPVRNSHLLKGKMGRGWKRKEVYCVPAEPVFCSLRLHVSFSDVLVAVFVVHVTV